MAELFTRNGKSDAEILEAVQERFSEEEFPSYVARYLEQEVASRNLSTTLRHRRFLFTDSFLLLWKWRVG